VADSTELRPNNSKGFEPAKVRRLQRRRAYVLSQRQPDPITLRTALAVIGIAAQLAPPVLATLVRGRPSRWHVVDHAHDPADIRYPGVTPLEGMEQSAAGRQRYADRVAERGGPFHLFMAVPHDELSFFGIDPATRRAIV
jgi:hypothetical protein